MKEFICNPILPLNEYIPDPEVHVFGDRVYIYGSHDEFNGKMYCENDYVTWSAPVNDLTDWRFDGVIYRKSDHQSPLDKGKKNMYAPDVAKGLDGSYYLYYSIADSSVISVAKSDSPTGPFSYYGDVKSPSGHVYGADSQDWFEFDPAVLVDGDRIYLYSGSGQKANEKNGHPVVGLFVRELEPDMVTAKTEPKIIMPADDDRRQPNFFEGASIRKFGDWYYLLYMATDLSGLHYLMSRYPDHGFERKGLLYTTSYNGLNDGTSVDDSHIIENNHGSMEKINGDYYVFNHRHTNRSHFSRQIVGEKLEQLPDGTFRQADYTSIGIRAKPFDELTTFPAAMTCGLINNKDITSRPYVTQEASHKDSQPESLVKNLSDGAELVYKSFYLPNTTTLEMTVRGHVEGLVTVMVVNDNEKTAQHKIYLNTDEWERQEVTFSPSQKTFDLILRYEGDGILDIKEFQFI